MLHLIYCSLHFIVFYSFIILNGFDWVEANEFFVEHALSSLFLFLVISRIKNRTWRVAGCLTSHLLLSLKAFLNGAYYYLFQSFLTAASFYVFIETNLAETGEFIINFFDLNLLIYLIAIVVSTILMYRHLKLPMLSSIFRWSLGLGFCFLLWFQFSAKNIYYVSLAGFLEYKNELSYMRHSAIAKAQGKFSNVVHNTNGRELYIIVIGESTCRDHMQLYGYGRNTTPLLDSMKSNLLVYNDIISPHTHTIPVLAKALTEKNSNNNDFGNGSIMQLLNTAGFKTYWLSNQRPIGMYENQTTTLAKATAEQVFINTSTEQRKTPYDGELTKTLKEVIGRMEKKVAVFIHLLGTHTAYDRRYPNAYSVFKSDPSWIRHNSSEAYRKVNTYDNAVLYNDKVVAEMIACVQNEKTNSFLLYFSDHGEDVYQVSNNNIHVETNATSPMYRIPFILWRSSTHKDKCQLDVQTNRKFMTDDLIYSIAMLCDVSYNGLDSTRSVFSTSFIERPRRVFNGWTYEELLEKEK